MKGIAPTHLQCNECGTRRPIEDDEDPTTLECEQCLINGTDPTCVELVAILPYPDGECTADDHVHADGEHVVRVDD